MNLSDELFSTYFVLNNREDYYNLKFENIYKSERIFKHLSDVGNTKSNFLKPVFVYTIFISKLFSSLFSLVSLFVNINLSYEYFQILLVVCLLGLFII
jgi:hypothetical protein